MCKRLRPLWCVYALLLSAILLPGCKAPEPKPPAQPTKEVTVPALKRRLEKNICGELNISKLLIHRSAKVCLVNDLGGKKTDSLFQTELETALANYLIKRGECTVIDGNDKSVKQLYEQHRASKELDLPRDLVLKTARGLKADNVLMYHIMKLEKGQCSPMDEKSQRLMMTSPAATKDLFVALELRVVDVSSGRTIAGGLVDEKGEKTILQSYAQKPAKPPEKPTPPPKKVVSAKPTKPPEKPAKPPKKAEPIKPTKPPEKPTPPPKKVEPTKPTKPPEKPAPPPKKVEPTKPTKPPEKPAPPPTKVEPAKPIKPPAPRPVGKPSALQLRLTGNICRKLDASKLLIYPSDRVWLLNIQGGKQTDALFETDLEKALSYTLNKQHISTVIGKNDPRVVELYKQHQKSKALDLSGGTILKTARELNADRVLTYRILQTERKKRGPMGENVQRLVISRPSAAKDIFLALELGVIDVPTTAAIAGGLLDEKDKTAFYDSLYPRKIVEPAWALRDRMPKEEREEEEVENVGRAYRAYSKWSDKLGPHGIYDSMEWKNWVQKNDELGPETLYSVGPSQILITTTPSKANVYLNDRPVGATPFFWSPEEDDKLTIYKDGYHLEEIQPPAGKSAFHVNLRPKY